jgi:hypothetical protein
MYFIHEKMRFLGMSNFNAYAIKMATDGYIIAKISARLKISPQNYRKST